MGEGSWLTFVKRGGGRVAPVVLAPVPERGVDGDDLHWLQKRQRSHVLRT